MENIQPMDTLLYHKDPVKQEEMTLCEHTKICRDPLKQHTLGGLSCLGSLSQKILFYKTQVLNILEGLIGLEELQHDSLRVSSQCLYPSSINNRLKLPPR